MNTTQWRILRGFIAQASNHGSQIADRLCEVPGAFVFVPNDRRMLANHFLPHGLEAGEATEASEMEVNLFSGHIAPLCKLSAKYVRQAVSPLSTP